MVITGRVLAHFRSDGTQFEYLIPKTFLVLSFLRVLCVLRGESESLNEKWI
jgi:hypothetical protein